jgi:hypothetical protein
MRKDLEEARRRTDQLDSETYPTQLAVVVAYLRRQLRLQLWLGEQEVRFAETGALPQSDIDGLPACRAAAERASRERAKGGCSVMGSGQTAFLHQLLLGLGAIQSEVQSFSKCEGHSDFEMVGSRRLIVDT